MTGHATNRWADAARLLGWAALLTPVTILIHELGHFAVPVLAGLPAELHPTTVLGGALLGEAPGWLVALQAGGGPIATILMSLITAYLFARDRRRLWALAVAIAAASRFLVTTGYLIIRLFLLMMGREFTASPNFDEHNVAQALGLPSPVLALAATLFLLAFLTWLLRRVGRGRRLIYLLATAGGVAAGFLLWAVLAPVPLMTIAGR